MHKCICKWKVPHEWMKEHHWYLFNGQVSTPAPAGPPSGLMDNVWEKTVGKDLFFVTGFGRPSLASFSSLKEHRLPENRVGQPVGFCTNSPRFIGETNIPASWLTLEEERSRSGGSDRKTAARCTPAPAGPWQSLPRRQEPQPLGAHIVA